jgi:pimeloyl-ACP methyl ester carboxylesterase
VNLLLLPGLLCDDAAWAPVVARLRGIADCRIAQYDDADSLAEMARGVLASTPAQFALAGHSMGARVAMEVCRLAPGRVSRLALLDTGFQALPAGAAAAEERARRLALVDRARAEGMRAMGREWLRPMVHPARLDDHALIEAILAMVERSTPQRFAGQVRALLGRPDLTDLLRSVRVPTLVACGREDAWSPVAQHEAIAALVPHSRLAVFDDCGHMAPMERPDAVARALVDWLRAASAADDPAEPAHRPVVSTSTTSGACRPDQTLPMLEAPSA